MSDEVPPRLRRSPRSETRRRLLDAAARVFADRGYDTASLDDVAAAAGFSKGAVYSNFADKREVFLALMQDRIAQRVEMVRSAGEALSAPDEARVAGAALEGLIGTEADWHLLFIEFWVRAVRDPSLRTELVAARRPMRELIASFLEERAAAHQRQLPASADQMAVLLLALSNGLAIEQLADPGSVDADLYATALRLLLEIDR